jgi:uncharacterized membrane protein
MFGEPLKFLAWNFFATLLFCIFSLASWFFGSWFFQQGLRAKKKPPVTGVYKE